jgi:hypothetical protein
MKKNAIILLLGLLLGLAAFSGFYYLGTATSRNMMREPKPELAWLKQEFRLSDAEFARISQMHDAYLPQCRERCQRIAEQDQQLQVLLSNATNLTAEIQNLIAARAQTRADCEAQMLKHFLAVSRTMPPEQGRRYLGWVESQCCFGGSAMESRHKTANSNSTAEHHHHM